MLAERGIAGAKRYFSASPSSRLGKHSTLTVECFHAGTKDLTETSPMKTEISPDDLPSPERRAEFQDMIDSLTAVVVDNDGIDYH